MSDTAAWRWCASRSAARLQPLLEHEAAEAPARPLEAQVQQNAHHGRTMTATSIIGHMKTGDGIYSRACRVGAMLRRCGAALLAGLHERRRREVTRFITQ